MNDTTRSNQEPARASNLSRKLRIIGLGMLDKGHLAHGWMMGVLMMLMVSAASSPVWAQAQAQAELRPPTTREDPIAPKVMVYLVGLLLVAGVVFAATLKSKRTHQD